MTKRLQSDAVLAARDIGAAVEALTELSRTMDDREIAEIINCTPVTVRRYIDGDTTPSRFVARNILRWIREMKS